MNAYSTLSQIKAHGWLDITTTDYDNMLLTVLEGASRDVDDHCSPGGRRHFYTESATELYDGAGNTLILSDDLLSITTGGFLLDIDGSGSYATVLTAADYLLYPLNKYPKTYIKVPNNSVYGSFASNVRAGVKIIGIFGYGDGKTPTPYILSGATVNTGGISATETTHALATDMGALFEAGLTILIGSEQLYITDVLGDTLTFERGVNGTTAVLHATPATIYIYHYPAPVVLATLIQASRIWKRRESGYANVITNPVTGSTETYRGKDPDFVAALQFFVKRAR